MKIQYTLSEDDFVEFQLFAASQSERINKRKKRGWFFLTLGSLFATVYFYLSEQNLAMVFYFLICSFVFGFFYPAYFTWRYKKHYRNYVRDNYSKRFGETEQLEITDSYILWEDKTSKGQINLFGIEKADETDRYLYLKISTGGSLIIPKDKIDNCDAIKKKLNDLGFTINNFLSRR